MRLNPYYSEGGITIYHAKAEEVLPRLPEKHFSVLVLDPPFTFRPEHIQDVLGPYDHGLRDAAAVLILGSGEGMPTMAAFGHPHSRPLDRMIEALMKTAGPILDPYMGSGTTLVAAKQLGREAVGVDIDEKYCRATVERLRTA